MFCRDFIYSILDVIHMLIYRNTRYAYSNFYVLFLFVDVQTKAIFDSLVISVTSIHKRTIMFPFFLFYPGQVFEDYSFQIVINSFDERRNYTK